MDTMCDTTGERAPATTTVTTGRPLDDKGEPTGGPALKLDPESRAAGLLEQSPRALVASPNTDTWATLLELPESGPTDRPDSGASDRPVLVQWLGPDAPEPAVHRHPASETFEALEGTLTLQVDGETRALAPGESATVDAGVEHTLRNASDETVAFRAELPSMRTVAALYTVWALDQEGAVNPDGQPGFARGIRLSADVYPDTTVTAVPERLQRVTWATLGRVLDAIGYAGIEQRYLADEFWDRRVEQPQF